MVNVYSAAADILSCSDAQKKSAMTLQLWQQWRQGNAEVVNDHVVMEIVQPGRPEKPELVHPNKLKRRSFFTEEGRLALMHAVAHIEFNAINLACDAVYRFRDLPQGYYSDWLQVAADEARHFSLVEGYLKQHGSYYGAYPAHNGLWDMAVKTADDHLARLAIVPRVLEARGLDVTPAMIVELEKAGDEAAVGILSTIYEEEIAHVAAGSRWFNYLCQQYGLEPEKQFLKLVSEYYSEGIPRGPLNIGARQQAGFNQQELELLQQLQSRRV